MPAYTFRTLQRLLMAFEHNVGLVLVWQFDQSRVLGVLIASANMTLILINLYLLCTNTTEPLALITGVIWPVAEVVNTLDTHIIAPCSRNQSLSES